MQIKMFKNKHKLNSLSENNSNKLDTINYRK